MVAVVVSVMVVGVDKENACLLEARACVYQKMHVAVCVIDN